MQGETSQPPGRKTMPAFDVRWVERWQKMVNQDSVARLLGRHFNADVMLEFGPHAYVVSRERVSFRSAGARRDLVQVRTASSSAYVQRHHRDVAHAARPPQNRGRRKG